MNCMNVCLSTVWPATELHASNQRGPAHWGFYRCGIPEEASKWMYCICYKFCWLTSCRGPLPAACIYCFQKCFFLCNSLPWWTPRNRLTSKYLENNLFNESNSHFIRTSHIRPASGRRLPLPVMFPRCRSAPALPTPAHSANTFSGSRQSRCQLPVSRGLAWGLFQHILSGVDSPQVAGSARLSR